MPPLCQYFDDVQQVQAEHVRLTEADVRCGGEPLFWKAVQIEVYSTSPRCPEVVSLFPPLMTFNSRISVNRHEAGRVRWGKWLGGTRVTFVTPAN